MNCRAYIAAILPVLLCGMLHAQVRFTADNRSGCVPFIVSFSDKSPGNVTSWEWDFGDGSAQSVKQNPVHTYTSAGWFSVKLKVTYANGTSRDTTYIRYIHTSSGPIVGYTVVPDSVCPGYPVQFTPRITSADGISRTSWDFRDGHADTSRNPQHSYAMSGWYRPVLRVTDTLGCTGTDSVSHPVYVKPKPKAMFYAADSIQCVKQMGEYRDVHFVNQSQGAVAYEWDFDDGSGSTDFQPQHRFPYGGYDITLVAKAANGCNDTLKLRNLVSIELFKPYFTKSDSVLCSLPGQLTLTGYGANYYRWRLDDGAGHIYDKMGYEFKPAITEPGEYNLQVIYQNKYGCSDTARYVKFIKVVDIEKFVPNVVIHDEDYCNPFGPISFVNKTIFDSAAPLKRGITAWNFNDGSANVIGDSVSHVFGSYGIFYVEGYFTTPEGCEMPKVRRKIRIKPLREVFITEKKTLGCVPFPSYMSVKPYEDQFDPDNSYTWDSPEADIVRYEWHWGNGDTTVTTGPRSDYVYQKAGIYYTFVVITNSQGCTDTLYEKIVCGNPPRVYWEYDSIGIKCASHFVMNLNVYDSLYYDPVLKDSVPYKDAGPADDALWFGTSLTDSALAELMKLSPDSIAATGANIGRGMHTFLGGAHDTGIVHLGVVAFYNGCPGKYMQKDSIAYMCPPIAQAPGLQIYGVRSSNFPEIREDAPICKYPYVHFFTGTKAATSHIWYFGNDSTDSAGHYWIGDTSHRDSVWYQFKPGSYMHNGKGVAHVHLVAINDDSTGIKGAFNLCKLCYDTAWADVKIIEVKPWLYLSDTDICTGDSITFRDSTISGSALNEWIAYYRVKSMSGGDSVITITGSATKPHYTYNDSTSPNGYGTVRLPAGSRFWEPGRFKFMMEGVTSFNVPKIEDGDTIYVLQTLHNHCSYRDTVEVDVFPKSAPIVQNVSEACVGDTVTFYGDAETEEPYDHYKIKRYLWNVAGRSDSNQNAKYVFQKGGDYDVRLFVTNEKDCDSSKVFKKQIFIQGVNATWTPSGNRYEVCNKSAIRLQSRITSVGSTSLVYRWVFNNGKNLYRTPKEVSGRTQVSPSFDVDSAGYVKITLYVYDSVSGCTSSFTDSIFVYKPKADFMSTNPLAPCPELQVDFRDSTPDPGYSGGRVVKWEWFFEDRDDTVWSVGRTPTFIYSHPGRYDVSLVVTDASGCTDTVTKPEYVRIEGADGFFTMDTTEGCMPLRVGFAVTLLFPADTVHLIFGDGSDRYVQVAYPGQIFTYTYITPGKYVPSMEMISWTRDADSTLIRCVQKYLGEDTVYVVSLAPAFESDTLVCVNASTTFKNHTTEAEGRIQPPGLGTLDSLVWRYGNGSVDRSRFDGSTRYNRPGWYTVTMRMGVRHCVADTSVRLRVVGPPDLRFTHEDTVACDSVLTLFRADSLRGDETELEWGFHDGTAVKGNPASHPYDRSGKYPCTLTVTYSAAGCKHTYDDTVGITIHPSPQAEFGIFDKEGKDVTDLSDRGIRTGETAKFTDRSQPGGGGIVYWRWMFGNGDSAVSAQGTDQEHRYAGVSGVQQVWLHIRDSYGCTDSVMHELLVTEFLSFPNIFSPNGDGINDFFVPVEVGGYFERFDMTIYNRWGGVMWQRYCTGGEKGRCPDYGHEDFWWNGKTATGADASEGVYFWVVSATPKSGTGDIILQGSVTLVR
ncbi:MAG: PKD domain-containing protein [Bacteroidales bacterium]|nr:PKD domain-containing protein [Bacteroidales bacterium]